MTANRLLAVGGASEMTKSCQRITVERQRQEAWESAVAAHVEALVSLGWKWEGRALRPGLNAALLHKNDSRNV